MGDDSCVVEVFEVGVNMIGDCVKLVRLEDSLVSSELVVNFIKGECTDEYSTARCSWVDCEGCCVVVVDVLSPVELSSRDCIMRSLVLDKATGSAVACWVRSVHLPSFVTCDILKVCSKVPTYIVSKF